MYMLNIGKSIRKKMKQKTYFGQTPTDMMTKCQYNKQRKMDMDTWIHGRIKRTIKYGLYWMMKIKYKEAKQIQITIHLQLQG